MALSLGEYFLNSNLDALLAGGGQGNGYSDTSYIKLRRLSDTRFVLLSFKQYSTPKQLRIQVWELSSGGTFTLINSRTINPGPTSPGKSAPDWQIGFAALADSRFVVFTGSSSPNPRQLRLWLYDEDGNDLGSGSVVADYDNIPDTTKPMTGSGSIGGYSRMFGWLGDYMDVVEASPGQLICSVTCQDANDSQYSLWAFQMDVSASVTPTAVGSPVKVFSYVSADDGDINHGRGQSPTQSIQWSSGLMVGLTWGTPNGRNRLYAVGATGTGPVSHGMYACASHVIEPIMRRTATGLSFIGHNESVGVGNSSASGEPNNVELVVNVDFNGTTFSNETRSAAPPSALSYSSRDYTHAGDVVVRPLYGQQRGRLLFSYIYDSTPPVLAFTALDLPSTTVNWDAPTEQVEVVWPSGYNPTYFQGTRYEGLTANLGVCFLMYNDPYTPTVQGMFLPVHDAAPSPVVYPLASASRGRRARYDPA